MSNIPATTHNAVVDALFNIGVRQFDAGHLSAWLSRWATSYSTDIERAEAYAEHQRQLAILCGDPAQGTCTGDAWCGCTCHACTVTFEHCDQVAPLVVDSLLTEADTLLPTLLASRLASASACFPAPDGGTVYVQSNGNRITIAVTEKDVDTQQLVTREFTATITEVK